MPEIRSGLRHVLALPVVYDSFQRLVGAYAWRARTIADVVLPHIRSGARIMDIGCGTCDVLRYLPDDVEYHGFDRNDAYIQTARKRFHGRHATFSHRSVGEDPVDGQLFDIVLALGLMHHLGDDEAVSLLQTAKNSLAPGGRLFLLDPVFTRGQSALARFIVSKDRGQNIRTEDGYKSLCSQQFMSVISMVDHSPLRIPYTGIVITCSMPPTSTEKRSV